MRDHTWPAMFKSSSLPFRLNCFLDLLILPTYRQSKMCGSCLPNNWPGISGVTKNTSPLAKSSFGPQAQIRTWLQSSFRPPRTPGPPRWGVAGLYVAPMPRIHPTVTPDQLGQYVEVTWRLLYTKDKSSLFDSMPRRVAAFIANNGGYTKY
ncbi:hypothetical protein TNCV_651021 [Trichonephila clavipes]|nr:hypothetical protein TNCV_651021 [Trichonephila clavipes]